MTQQQTYLTLKVRELLEVVPTRVELKGKFVNDGTHYEFEDFVFMPYNDNEGFTNLEIRDCYDNLIEEIAGVEIPDEDDYEELVKFEKLLTTILKGLDLV